MKYKLYELFLDSQLALPELEEVGSDLADVTMSMGEVPFEIENILFENPWIQISKTEILIKSEGFPSFYIREGREIRILEKDGYEEKDLVCFFYTTVLPLLLSQRNYTILQGTALEKNQNCLILAGESGTGKSAMALGLIEEGYRLVSEGFCAFNEEGTLISGLPCLMVWKDTMKQFLKEDFKCSKVRNSINKFYLPVPVGSGQGRVNQLVVLCNHNTEQCLVQKVKGYEKLQTVMNQLFHMNYTDGFNRIQNYKICSKIAQDASICKFTYYNSSRQYHLNLEQLKKEFIL